MNPVMEFPNGAGFEIIDLLPETVASLPELERERDYLPGKKGSQSLKTTSQDDRANLHTAV